MVKTQTEPRDEAKSLNKLGKLEFAKALIFYSYILLFLGLFIIPSPDEPYPNTFLRFSSGTIPTIIFCSIMLYYLINEFQSDLH